MVICYRVNITSARIVRLDGTLVTWPTPLLTPPPVDILSGFTITFYVEVWKNDGLSAVRVSTPVYLYVDDKLIRGPLNTVTFGSIGIPWTATSGVHTVLINAPNVADDDPVYCATIGW